MELARDGTRREWRFGEVADRAARLAGTFAAHGVQRGDVVMTLIGNRPDWACTMLACFRIGAVVLPCTEQLRAKDLRLRLDAAQPALVWPTSATRQSWRRLDRTCPRPDDPRRGAVRRRAGAGCELDPLDPCLITFTSGTAGEPKAVLHGQRYLTGQHVQAEHWLDARPDDLVWCTAAAGWSKSARNAFIAPVDPRRRRAPARRALRPAGAPRADRRASASTCSAWPRPSTA